MEEIISDDYCGEPPNAIFKNPGETYKHFIHRCDRSMAGIKSTLNGMCGSGQVTKANKRTDQTRQRNPRNFPKLINGGK